MTKHILSVVAFLIVSFAAQGLSHFVINAEHFAAVTFMRAEPIIPLGLFVMVLQGAMLSLALQAWRGGSAKVADGLSVACLFGAFLVSYIAIVEPSKYVVPSILDWFLVEASVGAVQFAVFGVVLGAIHHRFAGNRVGKRDELRGQT